MKRKAGLMPSQVYPFLFYWSPIVCPVLSLIHGTPKNIRLYASKISLGKEVWPEPFVKLYWKSQLLILRGKTNTFTFKSSLWPTLMWVGLKMRCPFLVKKVYTTNGKGHLILRHTHVLVKGIQWNEGQPMANINVGIAGSIFTGCSYLKRSYMICWKPPMNLGFRNLQVRPLVFWKGL